MSLGGHLIEFRNRLFKSGIAIILGMILGWWLTEAYVWDAIQEPVKLVANARHDQTSLVFPTITSSFDLRLQIAFTLGLLVSAPVWLYQIFAFLVPGLSKKERKFTFGFFASAIPLFFAGSAAGWFVLPNIVHLMTGFVPEGSLTLLTAREYIDFVLKLVVAIGIAFVLPVFIVLLNFAGVFSAQSIIRSWRVAILVITLFTAIATPSADVISMFVLAIPMVVLYFTAWFIAYLHDRRVAKRDPFAEPLAAE